MFKKIENTNIMFNKDENILKRVISVYNLINAKIDIDDTMELPCDVILFVIKHVMSKLEDLNIVSIKDDCTLLFPIEGTFKIHKFITSIVFLYDRCRNSETDNIELISYDIFKLLDVIESYLDALVTLGLVVRKECNDFKTYSILIPEKPINTFEYDVIYTWSKNMLLDVINNIEENMSDKLLSVSNILCDETFMVTRSLFFSEKYNLDDLSKADRKIIKHSSKKSLRGKEIIITIRSAINEFKIIDLDFNFVFSDNEYYLIDFRVYPHIN